MIAKMTTVASADEDAWKENEPILAAKSRKVDKVRVRIDMRGRSHGEWLIGSTDISSNDERKLAADLIRLADESDVKVAKKTEDERRYKAWRDQEISAGRCPKPLSLGQLGNSDG